MGEKGKRIKTKDTGVYVLTSTVKRHNGKPDVCYSYTYKDANGKKIYITVGWRSQGVSQAHAVVKRREMLESLRVGKDISRESRRITFGEAWRQWEKTHMPTVKDGKNMQQIARNYLLPIFDRRAMCTITPLELDELKLELTQKGLTGQTVKHVLGLVRRVFRKALAWRLYYGPVPTDGITMPKVDNARTGWLEEEEAEQLLAELAKLDPTWHDMALLSLYSGMRLNDVLNLRCRQVRLDSGYIDVIEAKPGTYTAYFSERAREMLKKRMGSNPEALLFPSYRTGSVLSKRGRYFQRAVDICGFNEGITSRRDMIVFHSLRHSFASLLAKKGVPMHTIRELMGHKSMKMTERYSKLAPDTKKAAIALLDNIHK